MAELRVEGKAAVEVPQDLADVVAAGNGVRVLYRLIDGAIFFLPYATSVLLYIGAINASTKTGNSVTSTLSIIFMVLASLILIVNFILLLTKGQSFGMRIVGIRWVSFLDGQIRPGSTFLKILLENLLGVIPLGFLAFFLTQDDTNRHIIDRASKIITINTKLGRDSATTPAPLVDDSIPHIPQPWNSSSGETQWAPDGTPLSTMLDSTPRIEVPFTELSTSLSGQQESATPVTSTSWGLPSASDSYPPQGTTTPTGSTAAFSEHETAAASHNAEPATQSFTPNPNELSTPTLTPSTSPSPFAPPADAFTTAHSAVDTGLPSSSTGANGATTSSAKPANDEDLDRTIARRPVDSILLTFDDGTHHFLVGQALIGRAPEPEAGHIGAQLVPIHDPGRSISKVHMALSVQSGAVLIEDMHSMNGTTVILPTGTAQAVLPGAPVLAAAGSTVYFGERSVKISG